MKVFVIGGCSVPDSDVEFASQNQILKDVAQILGRSIVQQGHDLLACSAFPGSVDVEVMTAAGQSMALSTDSGPIIEIHFPSLAIISQRVSEFTAQLSLPHIQTFPHPVPHGTLVESPTAYDWLLSQLIAMERSDGIIAIGGKPDGTASLLLLLAESRRKPIVPLTYLQGAADQSYQRRQYGLEDCLGEKVGVLRDITRVEHAVTVLERLSARTISHRANADKNKFFLSYPQSRPEEADFVEMVLRRRNLTVFRDERDFGAGQALLGEIDEYIHQADVFIALWSRDYACSPWCFDELMLALQRKEAGKLEMWLLCIDDTRIVPPDARAIVTYPVRNRFELERQLLLLLEGDAVPSE